MLTLIPTPIDEVHNLEATALELLKNCIEREDTIICVEEEKIARRRWIRWGLDRNYIEKFVLYNEHTRAKLAPELLLELKRGKNVYLMSDCGLPAFCDPGLILVDLCHQHKIKVSSTPFYNSPTLALALSGFNHDKFIFEGFIAKDNTERKNDLKRIVKNKLTTIIMDTPYRLNKLVEELRNLAPNRMVFLAIDLNKEDELLRRDLLSNMKLEKQKREFILILGPMK